MDDGSRMWTVVSAAQQHMDRAPGSWYRVYRSCSLSHLAVDCTLYYRYCSTATGMVQVGWPDLAARARKVKVLLLVTRGTQEGEAIEVIDELRCGKPYCSSKLRLY